MEKHEYQDDTVPRHVANFLRQKIEEKALRQIEKSERPHMDDDEMRQVEPGQQFIGYNFCR